METNGLNLNSRSRLPSGPGLRPGERLQASVTGQSGESRYTLCVAGQSLQVESATALTTGQKLNLLVVRQENGSLGLQMLPDTGEPEASTPPAGSQAGTSAAKEIASATAQLSRPAEVRLAADAVRTLLPASSSAPSGSDAANRSGSQRSVPESSAGAATSPARPPENAAASDYEGTVLQIVRDDAGKPVLVPQSGTGVTANGWSSASLTEIAWKELFQASAQASFQVQTVHLQLVIQTQPHTGAQASGALSLPPLLPETQGPAPTTEETLFARLPLNARLLQALPAPLAGAQLTLLPLTDAAAPDNAFGLATKGNPLPLSQPLQLPAGTTATSTTVTIAPEAILTGTLQTSRNAPDCSASDSLAAHVRAAGLTPGAATLEAASALSEEGVAISRGNLQTLLALTAGRSSEERAAFLQAGARLLGLDAPVAAPLAAGMANLLDPEISLAQLTGRTADALSAAAAALPEGIGAELQNQARFAGSLAVLVGNEETPQTLSGFVSSLGREVLSSAQEGVENAAARLLATSPALQRIDAALEVVLARLNNRPLSADSASAAAAGTPAASSPGPATPAGIPAFPAADVEAVAVQGPPLPVRNNGQDGGNTTPAANPAGPAGAAVPSPAQSTTPAIPQTGAAGADLAERLRLALSLFSQQSAAFASPAGAHPGVQDFPAYALPVDAPANTGDRARLEQTLLELARAGTPEETARAAREALRGIDAPTLRELASVLQQAERDEAGSLPGMQQLRDASDALRDLGRTFVAQKAETLATQDQTVWAGSVPLRFGNETKDGHLQMFYRKGGKEGKDWTQRVVLDLDMSGIGAVVGDLKFFKGQLAVSLLSPDAQTVHWLESGADELQAGLEAAGFPCTPAFRILPRKASGTTGAADTQPAPRTAPGRLDVRA